MFTFVPPTLHGALAHPARASDWQSEGDRFESDMLHNPFQIQFGNGFFY